MATPPTFTAGQVLTAAQMNKAGRWLISTTTITAGASTHPVSNVFSSDYDNYEVVVSGGSGSGSAYLTLILGATVTGYYYATTALTFAAGAVSYAFGANAASFANAGYMTTSTCDAYFQLRNPYASDETTFWGQSVISTTSGSTINTAGYLNNTTSYTGFTLATTSGTFGSAKVRVYGIQNG